MWFTVFECQRGRLFHLAGMGLRCRCVRSQQVGNRARATQSTDKPVLHRDYR